MIRLTEGTSNFWSMDNFPIWAKMYEEDSKLCPDCYTWQDADNDICEFCDCDLSDVIAETYLDEYVYNNELKEIDDKIDEFNDTLIFHKVEIKSGYYQGVQFYVDCKYRVNRNNELYDFETDEDVQLEYDFDSKYNTIAEMQKGYEDEIHKINSWLERIGKNFGFEKYGVVARFSNGETMYTKLD